MEFIAKNMLRGAGCLVAAQVFLTFGLTGEGLVENLVQSAKFAVPAVPALAAGAFLTSENSLRAVGFTVLLWAGAGTAMFFGAVYGDPEANNFAAEFIPGSHDMSLGFGFANLALVLLIGLGLWLRGLHNEPAHKAYYGVG